MRRLLAAMFLMLMVVFVGCSTEVPPGNVGRVNTPSGWQPDVLKPGRHTCYGRDWMYLLDTTNKAFQEEMNILVGGKVNLKLTFTIRVRANTEDNEMLKKAFESIQATESNGVRSIGVEQMYKTFLQMKTLAIPRGVYEVQPDIQTAVSNSPELAAEVRKRIMEAAKSTPLVVEDAEVTNYDWPDSITKAQEDLVQIKMREEGAEAQVRADLKKAEGQLKVEEANKLVELKKAEAVAESIDIIKKKLADAPEYLVWHQVRVMGEAAMGPNNCFILYPYFTDSAQVNSILDNANLSQMLNPEGLNTKTKKQNSPPASKGKSSSKSSN